MPGRLKCGFTTLTGESYDPYFPHTTKIRHSYLGYFYWGCILSFGISHRLIQHIYGSSGYNKKRGLLTKNANRGFGRLYQWIYTHLVIAFPIETSERRVLWFDLPRRIDAIIIAGFWVLSAVLSCISYILYDDNI